MCLLLHRFSEEQKNSGILYNVFAVQELVLRRELSFFMSVNLPLTLNALILWFSNADF